MKTAELKASPPKLVITVHESNPDPLYALNLLKKELEDTYQDDLDDGSMKIEII